MAYIIWGLLGILAFVKKNNKFVTMLIVGFIICIFCFNTANPDLNVYIEQYNFLGFHYTEPIFIFLSSVFYNLGLKFSVYRCFLVLISLLLVVSTIYRYSPYPTLVLFLYTIYPLSIDVVQLRFFVGYSILLYAMRFIIDYQEKKKIKYIWLYFTFVILAGGCHYGCVLYAILGLFFLKIEKHKVLYFIIIPAFVIMFIVMIDKFEPIISYFIGSKINTWIIKEKAATGLNIVRILVSRFMPLLFVFFITYVKRNAIFNTMYRNSGLNGVTIFFRNVKPNEIRFFNQFYDLKVNKVLFLSIYYISLFSIFEITIAGDYERMTRLGLLLSAILISRLIYYLTALNREIASVFFLMLFIAYFASIMFFMSAKWSGSQYLYINYVFRNVMENNSLLGIY